MERTKLLLALSAGLLGAAAVTSCASQNGPGQNGPGQNGPGGGTTSPSGVRPAAPVTQSSAPSVSCAAFLPSTSCGAYTSISGSSDGTEMPWVAAGTVTVQLETVDGTHHLVVRTPCNPLSAEATITGNTLQVGRLASGASGCIEAAEAQEQWVAGFLRRPIEMSFSDGALTWKSGTDTLTFKSQ